MGIQTLFFNYLNYIMKIQKLFFLSFIAATLLLTACNNGDEGETPTYYMEAKVDGATFEAEGSTLTGQAAFGEVVLSGFEFGTTESITLNLQENLEAGGYNMSGNVSDVVSAAYYPGGVGSNTFGDISGELIISDYDTVANTIKGSFNFVGEDINGVTVNVTDGKLFMKYQQ